jgi:hypothetical protein
MEEVLEVDRVTFQPKKRSWWQLHELKEFSPTETVASIAEQVKLMYREYAVNDKLRFDWLVMDLSRDNVVANRIDDLLRNTGVNRKPLKISQDGADESVRQFDLIYNLRMAVEEGRFEVDEAKFGTAWREQLAKMDDQVPWRPNDVGIAAAICLAFWKAEQTHYDMSPEAAEARRQIALCFA